MKTENLPTPSQNQSASQPEMTDEMVLRFLQVLDKVREEELSCSEMYARLDEFVEAEIQEGKDASQITPLIHEHLDMCSDCCDEYEALLAVVEHNTEDLENKKDGQ